MSDLFNNFKSELETATLYLDCICLMIQSHSYFPPERPSYTLHMLNKTNLEPTQVKDAYATHLLLISHYALFQCTATRSSLFAFLSGLGHKHFCQQLFLGYQRIWQIHRLQCDWQRVGWPNFYQVKEATTHWQADQSHDWSHQEYLVNWIAVWDWYCTKYARIGNSFNNFSLLFCKIPLFLFPLMAELWLQEFLPVWQCTSHPLFPFPHMVRVSLNWMSKQKNRAVKRIQKKKQHE